jgi:transglutaminase-like putative cysteine protease
VFQRFALLIEAGRSDVRQYAIPAPLTDGIRLMVVVGVLVVGLTVDALAVTCRNAAPAGLPLLALYAIAAGLAQSAADWLWFLLAAAGYLLLLLAEGRDRLARWGRVFGSAPPGRGTAGGPEPASGAIAPVRAGRRIGAVALGIAVIVPLVLPTPDGGLLDPSGRGRGVGPDGGGTISAVNPLVSLQNSLNQPENRQVMSYRTDSGGGDDQYLRIVSLDDFDGTSWKPSVRHITDVPDVLPAPQGLGPGVRTTKIRTTIAAADWYAQDWLPMPYPASQVRIAGRWRYEPVGRTLVGDHGQTTKGARYEVTSLEVRPTAEQLADAPPAPPDLVREFTKVPKSLPSVVAATALQVTRGAKNNYERAVKLQDWFAMDGGFTYNTNVQSGTGSAAIVRFLHDKEGFCIHFSFSMAAMARTLGIPARVAVGFTPGTPLGDNTMSVGLKDAHAWPELYFQGVGWTRFEPTPDRGSVPEYAQPDAPSSTSSDPAVPSRTASPTPSAEPTASDSCTSEEKRLDTCQSTAPQATGGSGGDGPPVWLILAGTLGALALLLLPVLPMLWRIRVRARRLGRPGRTEADVAARVLAAWQEVTDTAWDFGIVPDGSETPRTAAARIARTARLDEAASACVHRIANAVEQVLFAPRPEPAAGLADDARRLSAALRALAGRGPRLRALLAPRSAVRMMWAVTDRRHALGARLAGRWSRLRPAVRHTSRRRG